MTITELLFVTCVLVADSITPSSTSHFMLPFISASTLTGYSSLLDGLTQYFITEESET
jgi:hypothetical protein